MDKRVMVRLQLRERAQLREFFLLLLLSAAVLLPDAEAAMDCAYSVLRCDEPDPNFGNRKQLRPCNLELLQAEVKFLTIQLQYLLHLQFEKCTAVHPRYRQLRLHLSHLQHRAVEFHGQ